jgi:hypothetical protein
MRDTPKYPGFVVAGLDPGHARLAPLFDKNLAFPQFPAVGRTRRTAKTEPDGLGPATALEQFLGSVAYKGNEAGHRAHRACHSAEGARHKIGIWLLGGRPWLP